MLYPGVSSIAGFMHVLYYDAKSKTTAYVVGGHRAPRELRSPYQGSDPPGRAVAIPGAVFGFAELVRRFGRRPLAEATSGAAKLARDGFEVSALYAAIVGARTDVLARTPYGRSTYLPGGRAVTTGETLRLPTYAETLDRFGHEGASFFSGGEWAKEFVDVVNAEGGIVAMGDLGAGAGEVMAPIAWHRGDVDLMLASGPALSGTARVIFGLDLLDGFGSSALPPFSPEWVAAQLRVYAYAVGQTAWLERPELLARAAEMPLLIEARARDVVRTASSPTPTATAPRAPQHSSAVVVVDADGNVAVGMHTINDYPFGKGIFVRGVPLATSIAIPTYQTKIPGADLPVGVSPILALRGGVPVLALAQFNVGGFPADIEVTSAVLDGKLALVDAATGPRIAATYPGELHGGKAVVVVDPRYSRETLCALAASMGSSAVLEADVRGVLAAEGSIDAVAIAPNGGDARLQGVPAEILHGRALGY